MCGIVGYVGSRPAGPVLIDGLRRLEYRGYDSAGIAVLDTNGDLSIHKRVGKLETLASAIAGRWPNGHEGIGHTRWATHGKPNDVNAHPRADCNAGGVVIGYGAGENLLASDLPAILPYTRRVGFLEDREVVRVTATSVSYWNSDGRPLEKQPQEVPYDPVSAAKGTYKHFMLKEIMEQPESMLNTIRGRAQFDTPEVQLEDVPLSKQQISKLRRVVLVGMGTSLHAAMIGRHYMERIAGISAEVDNASEYRYRGSIIGHDTLVVSVGQSGETADTLAAMENARRKGTPQITVCNVVGSQATRLSHSLVYTRS